MKKSSTVFVGMDVHKESIEIAIADEGEVRRYGEVGGDAAAVDRVVRKLRSAHRDFPARNSRSSGISARISSVGYMDSTRTGSPGIC